jgi:hypothetical protein
VLPVYDDERKPRHVLAFEAASDKLLLTCKPLRGDDDGKAQANDRDFFIIASLIAARFARQFTEVEPLAAFRDVRQQNIHDRVLAVEGPPPPRYLRARCIACERDLFRRPWGSLGPTQCRSASAGGQNGMRQVVPAKLSALSTATSSESRVRARLTRLFTVPTDISQIAAASP